MCFATCQVVFVGLNNQYIKIVIIIIIRCGSKIINFVQFLLNVIPSNAVVSMFHLRNLHHRYHIWQCCDHSYEIATYKCLTFFFGKFHIRRVSAPNVCAGYARLRLYNIFHICCIEALYFCVLIDVFCIYECLEMVFDTVQCRK